MNSFKKYTSLYTLSIVALAVSCTKENKTETKDNTRVYSNTPALQFVSVTPNTVQELDSLVFTIYYEDGNGDLGENNFTAKNIFITDLRDNTTDSLRIPRLLPNDEPTPINGNLNVVVPDIIIKKSADTTQTVTYKIQIQDRAGNKSNTVTSSVVTIHKK